MPEFRRPHHRALVGILGSMNASFLERSGCFFGGGTCIALMLDEFRESRDIDFLCASRDGFRALRESVTEDSLGKIMKRKVALAREVRADRDGIRTFFSAGDLRIKLEIILEARIDLRGAPQRFLGVPVLDLECLAAEKFLANADRGLDDTTRSRDVIDLAFLAASRGKQALEPGLQLAETAYGFAVRRALKLALAAFSKNPRHASNCAHSLGIEDLVSLRKGLAALKTLAGGHRR
jgi:Nucleotidyl transferase AbiEii toxin, Type IV TA system